MSRLLFGFLSFCLLVCAQVPTVTLDKTAVDHFLGFGVQWDPYEYQPSPEAWKLTLERVDYMRPQFLRVMWWGRAYCQGFDANGAPIYVWSKGDAEAEKALRPIFSILDYAQSRNIDVMLGEWNPPFRMTPADPRWARLAADFAEYLIKQKKYTVIRYYNLMNEPNGGWMWPGRKVDYDAWATGIRNMRKELDARGLKSLPIAGPDNSGDWNWLDRVATDLRAETGFYEMHWYVKDHELRDGEIERVLREKRAAAVKIDPDAIRKGLYMGEAGVFEGRVNGDQQPRVKTFVYGVLMADYMAQVARAGWMGASAWDMDDAMHVVNGLPHPEVPNDLTLKIWGFWNSQARPMGKPDDEAIRPWFYTWSLMSRLFPKGVRVLTGDAPAGVRVIGTRDAVMVVNTTDSPQKVNVRVPGAKARELSVFRYFDKERPVDDHGFPKAAATIGDADLDGGVVVDLPSRGVVFLKAVHSDGIAELKTWPEQKKSQAGLAEPQPVATMPNSNVATQKAVAVPVPIGPVLKQVADNEWAIRGGWRLIPAPQVSAAGPVISRTGFKLSPDWLSAVVPGTVLTTLIDRGVYPDPDYALNNLAIPETLNKQDYWYRVELDAPKALAGRRSLLTLNGINYAASVWMNGRELGVVRGAFTRGQFDISSTLIAGARNTLAVRVSPPPHPGIPHEQSMKAGPGDNGGIECVDGPTFFCMEGWDWIPGIRDRGTGIWQDVTIAATGDVRIGDVQVVTRVPDSKHASVSITAPLVNSSNAPVSGVLTASFEGVTLSKKVTVAPGESAIAFDPANLDNPRLWWPNGYGKPELYHLRLSFAANGRESDAKRLRFGVREISYELTLRDAAGSLPRVAWSPAEALHRRVVDVTHNGIVQTREGWVHSLVAKPGDPGVAPVEDRRASPHLIIRVNGVRIAVRGGNWGLDDSRKRVSRERLEPYVRLHRDANLNMIRNWCGQSTEEALYDLADEYGLLVWNDFWLSTQDFNMEPADTALFLANAQDTVMRFRNHPSIALWCGRNEGVPPPVLNAGLDAIVRDVDGTRMYMPNSRLINLQSSGPWKYGEAAEFFTDRARGFSTELGIPSPPSAESLRAMMPDQWPPSDTWAYHDWHQDRGGSVAPFMAAIARDYGAPSSLADFDRKAQMMNYVSHRAMFEGFNARLFAPNSGRLMWMSHPAWPSTVWQLYGSDYETYGAFFGVKKACEPVHVQMNLPDHAVAVVNTTAEAISGYRARARLLSAAGAVVSEQTAAVSAQPGESVELFQFASDGFVKLELFDGTGALVSDNFYWEPAQAGRLPETELQMVARPVANGVAVEVTNPGSSIALLNRVVLRNASTHARILPAYADANYFELLPGEKRVVMIETPDRAEFEVSLEGWNVEPARVRVGS